MFFGWVKSNWRLRFARINILRNSRNPWFQRLWDNALMFMHEQPNTGAWTWPECKEELFLDSYCTFKQQASKLRLFEPTTQRVTEDTRATSAADKSDMVTTHTGLLTNVCSFIAMRKVPCVTFMVIPWWIGAGRVIKEKGGILLTTWRVTEWNISPHSCIHHCCDSWKNVDQRKWGANKKTGVEGGRWCCFLARQQKKGLQVCPNFKEYTIGSKKRRGDVVS